MSEDKRDNTRKLFQVAKELNRSHTELMEFLNSKGYETPKKHMSVVTTEMYEVLVKHLDPNRWRKLQEDLEGSKEGIKHKEAEKLREAELDRILQTFVNIPQKGSEIEAEQPDVETVEPAKEAASQSDLMKFLSMEDMIKERLAERMKEEKIKEEEKRKEAEAKAEAEKFTEKERKVEKPVQKQEVVLEKKEIEQIEAEAERIIKEAEAIVEKQISESAKSVEITAARPEEYKEMQAVDEVVAQALELARRKPVTALPVQSQQKKGKEQPVKEKGTKEASAVGTTDEEEKDKKKKRSRKKKKPRRPEVMSAAAIGLEKERRSKKPAKKKIGDTEEEEPRRRRRKSKKKKVDFVEVDASIKKTLAQMDDRGKGKKRRRKLAGGDAEIEIDSNALEVTEFISAQELANLMGVGVNDVIKKALEMGLLISINQRLDKDTITLLTDEFGFSASFISSMEETVLDEFDNEDAPLEPRAPVVTVMGHVDHGKTSLLDFIRRSHIIDGESGGITQHIGAYKVNYNNRYITFLDTPGHEAFTAMRARGAQITDIVVLVVAADDQVMPQTLEAINHAQAASVPIIIAINKIDKANAQPDKVKQQLADHGVLVESWGGKYQCTEISAKFGQGVDKLMEEILLLTDMLELQAQYECKARGVIIDSKLDKGRGALATVLIEQGVLKVGDHFVADQYCGKVRALVDERGHKVEFAGPSDPIQILGFEGTPQAGEKFVVTPTEKEARSISLRRQQLQREQSFRQIKMITLDQISDRIKFGEVKELPLILKGDVHGSVEAIADSLMKLKTQEVGVSVVHKGVGAITEGDVLLASASKAIILGFHVHANKKARELAEREQIEIKSYRIIYDVVNDIKQALEGMLRPDIKEEIAGEVEVRDIFRVSNIGAIAGCYVTDGKIERSLRIKVYREGVEIWDGELESLKRFKDDVREVVSGFECGIKIKNFNDVKIGDVIQSYKIVETKRALNM